ncbi:hypothetical protein ACFFSY_34110 [Paenibacillus aurantiacus]|uniref:YfhD family protein n=1 Tax=Paenibacillus aurantiacus TaxID=1936118 RepID=A0ABV5L0J1_9BACL
MPISPKDGIEPVDAGQAGRASRPVDEVQNGSMVQDAEDMRRLGRDMERMKTNHELERDGLVPDPIQE